ncbi:hypothetical protein HYDPIDRAFT_104507 [Hydnomerulius pinastri MD-312]|nr:hypothetical protein HYDPIDRAFT_104507 [Hydnomerulius pinastri MD-312]
MAPATRSSAPSTPSKPRVSTGSGSLPTPSTTPRRTPHCTKCHRPRAGHPRSGCPYVDTSQAANPPSPSTSISASTTGRTAPAGDDGIADEMSSLRIISPTEANEKTPAKGRKLQRRLSVRFALLPTQTLESLSTTSSELADRLLQPGMMGNTSHASDEYVLSWRRNLDEAEIAVNEHSRVSFFPKADEDQKPLSARSTPSRRMPCMLDTPTASQASTEPLSEQGIGGSAINMNETIFLLPDPDVKKPKSLARTMSVEQRSLFLEQLNQSSNAAPATLVSIPLADVEDVRIDAERVGFIIRVLPSGGDDGQRWVILGTEEKAVDLLALRFAEEERKSAKVKPRGGKFRAVAGGVVVGAVATWTGLAFA